MNCKPMVMFYFFLFILYTWHICLSLFSIFCFLLSVTYFKYTACSAKHINLNSLKYTPTFSIQNRTQLISDSSLIILPCWLPCKTLPNRFKQLLRMHNYRTHVNTYTIYMYPIYICIDCATAHYFGKFFGHCTRCWQMEIDVRWGEEGSMHPISPENADNPLSVCRLAPSQFGVFGGQSKLLL